MNKFFFKKYQSIFDCKCNISTSEFSVFVDRLSNPVDSGVVSNCVVSRVDNNNFEIFVGTVLANPVRIEHSEALDSLSNSFFSTRAQISCELKLVNTNTGGLSINDSLRNRSLSATSSNTDSPNNVAFLVLVTQLSGLVRSGRSRNLVDDRKLSVFPGSETEDERHQVRLFLSPKLFEIFVSTHFFFFLLFF